MSKKDVVKLVAGFAVIGTFIGLLLAYFKKYQDFSAEVNADTDEYEEDLSDDSYDSGLASFSDSGRNYISLD